MQLLAGVFNLSCIYVHVLRKYNPWDRRSHEHARQNKITEIKNIAKLISSDHTGGGGIQTH